MFQFAGLTFRAVLLREIFRCSQFTGTLRLLSLFEGMFVKATKKTEVSTGTKHDVAKVLQRFGDLENP